MIALIGKLQRRLLGVGLVVLLVGTAAVIAAAGTKNAAGSNPSSVVEPAAYAGADACKQCHEDVYKKQFENTPHFKTALGGGHGCESCHGPGAEHVAGGGDVEKIVRFAKLSQEEATHRCLECHAESAEQGHFTRSGHAASEVGCLDCHSPHHAREPQRLLVNSQPQLCYRCHTATKAEFAKPFRHRVNEGLIQCSDCHNVHGTGDLRQARSAAGGEAACFKCHVDKQGPFVYEHVPVNTEGCSGCHTPHASTNPRFLRVNNVSLLCLQCHSAPALGPSGPAHNLSQKYQACTMCHGMIHGSNFSNVFFK